MDLTRAQAYSFRIRIFLRLSPHPKWDNFESGLHRSVHLVISRLATPECAELSQGLPSKFARLEQLSAILQHRGVNAMRNFVVPHTILLRRAL